VTSAAETPAEARLRQAIERHRQGLLSEARADYESVLALDPRQPRALRLLAGLYLQAGQPALAAQLIAGAPAEAAPDPVLALLYGSALVELKQYGPALAAFDRAIELKPDLLDAHLGRGNMLAQLLDHEAALASYDRALALDSGNPWVWNNRGIALFERRQYPAAIASYDEAIARKPDYADAHYNRGNALRGVPDLPRAVESYDRAIAIDRDHVNALLNRGTTLLELERYEAAIESYGRVLALTPGNAEAHNNRGAALSKLQRYEAALADFDRALALRADFANAHYNRGNALRALKRHEQAAASYTRALELGAQVNGLLGFRLLAKAQICDWRGIDEEIAALAAAIERGQAASDPFIVLSLSNSAPLQRMAAELWVDAHYTARDAPAPPARRARRDRIRVGYFSPDFRNHPVAHLSAALFESHDRSAFEVIGFSLGPNTRDDMRRRLEKGFDRFIDLEFKSDAEGAEIARDLEIDIGVDLGGFTAGARPGIFAGRAAPLQVGYLGYTGTTGASYMDYLIADRVVIPDGDQGSYREKIIYLPHSFQVNDPGRRIADQLPARREIGLPADAFVFCCFNNSNKIMPGCFDGWMRILRRVEGSVLWLLEDNAKASDNLRRAASERGVEARRLIFAGRVPPADHLARHCGADLVLDTLPYNAHTTASDALWMGVPVLTHPGATFAGRVAASLLTAVGLPELITSSQAQYEELAVALATHPQRLAGIRRRLAENRRTAPLFDAALSTRHIESAFRQIVERQRAHLTPQILYIACDARTPPPADYLEDPPRPWAAASHSGSHFSR
jgi:predicted O-linked N-acetylglucosamine transferase (SPINDLY family)/thioredoxin-like negative regulator of GroEL